MWNVGIFPTMKNTTMHYGKCREFEVTVASEHEASPLKKDNKKVSLLKILKDSKRFQLFLWGENRKSVALFLSSFSAL